MKKNVVLISMDDSVAFWHYKDFFGQSLSTPNLDKIRDVSTTFESAYCQAPMCSPSRTSFMTGKSPFQTGVLLQDPEALAAVPGDAYWTHQLKNNGYYCASVGKVERTIRPLKDEIREKLYSDAARNVRGFNFPRKLPRNEDDQILSNELTELGGFMRGKAVISDQISGRLFDTKVARFGVRSLRRMPAGTPFYVGIGFSAPHGPWVTPIEHKNQYNPSAFIPPDAWSKGFKVSSVLDEEFPPNFNNDSLEHWQKSVRNYFSALSYVDKLIGNIWANLKVSAHADNTIVVILADHGLHLGERNRFRKHTLWEQVANVPLIIHDPMRPNKQVIRDPVGLIDVGPTIMDMLGLPPIEDSVGQSLRPLMEGQSNPHRAIPTFLGDHAAIRKGDYRYIRYSNGSTELYDLKSDWWQTSELGSSHPAFASMSQSLEETCVLYGMDLTTVNV